MVLTQSNIILSGGDPELIEDEDDALTAFLEAGARAVGADEAAGRRAAWSDPTDDLTTALVTTEVDGERLTHQEIASFFILLLRRRQRDHPQRDHPGRAGAVGAPRAAGAGGRPTRALTRTAVEEIVRWASPVTWMRRTATQDGERQRPPVPRPATSSCSSTARPTATPRSSPTRTCSTWPATPTRTSASARTGPHFCLGAHLARREIGGGLPGAVRPAARPRGQRRAGPAAVVVRQRHQAAAGPADGGAVTRVEVDRERCVGLGGLRGARARGVRGGGRRRPRRPPAGAGRRRPARRPRRRARPARRGR